MGKPEIIRDGKGEVIGFWFEQIPEENLLSMVLRFIAASEKIDEAAYVSICLGDYRVLDNTSKEKKGHYIMLGSAAAPGEPIAPLQSVRWKKGEPNPKSQNVILLSEIVKGVRFSCPTCGLPNYCFESHMAVDAGAMVHCGHCGNIAHVPSAYKTSFEKSNLEIRGSSYVPISEFGDWYFGHPCYSSSNAEDLGL